jgi:hypothetical protein
MVIHVAIQRIFFILTIKFIANLYSIASFTTLNARSNFSISVDINW